jgi:hypothetical protein
MTATINASTSSGIVQTADTSGSLALQSDGTTKLTVASTGVTAINLTATGTSSIANLTTTGTFGGGVITSGTSQASTSGTAITFTSIPSWVKRITVMLNNVSTNGGALLLFQLGTSSGFQTTGYITGGGTTTGIAIAGSVSGSDNRFGSCTFSLLGSNNWVASGNFVINGSSTSVATGGVTLSDVLTQIRMTTVNGTDTFDAGSINILYEG